MEPCQDGSGTVSLPLTARGAMNERAVVRCFFLVKVKLPIVWFCLDLWVC